MTYASYLQVVKDINYKEQFDANDRHSRFYGPYYEPEEYIDRRTINKLKKEWLDYVKEEYESTKKSNSSLGKFLAKYPLKFKEFCVLIELIGDNNSKSDFEIENGFREFGDVIKENIDIFKKHKVRYQSSQLRRFKLVYKITHSLRPMKTVYEISYKTAIGD